MDYTFVELNPEMQESLDIYLQDSELAHRVENGELFYLVFDEIFGDFLEHYGTPRHSGRYPWGSGENPYQHNPNFLSYVRSMKADGYSETEIAKAMGISTTEFRKIKTLAVTEERQYNISRCVRLKQHGYSDSKIAELTGLPVSTVRDYLDPSKNIRVHRIDNVSNYLRDQVDSKGIIDIGPGVEMDIDAGGSNIGVSSDTLKAAVKKLQQEGYVRFTYAIPRADDTGRKMEMTVLCPPGTEFKDFINDQSKIHTLTDYFEEGGSGELKTVKTPENLSSKRIQIIYGDEGGTAKDGVIELRPGVSDLTLGNSKYAQARIAVDGTHYLKGMAIYADDLPPGIDVRFYTNKPSGTPMIGPKDNSVLKPMKKDKDGNIDPDNPFGALIKAGGQTEYIGEDGKTHISVVNKIKEEGDWDKYSKTLASQFLAKQPLKLVNQQLSLSYAEKVSELEDIMDIPNKTLRKRMLLDYAEECDKNAVTLKAAALPGQSSKVILPCDSVKDGEIFAPSYNNGQQVALVRYPHAGIFEIPILSVNNKNDRAVKIFGNDLYDAVGINSKVAQQLSGADFDGDSVVVIPLGKSVKINAKSPLPDLQKFEPKDEYRGYSGMKRMSNTNQEMGKISNLITDMTIKGATEAELVRAVKHSMVVIDAEKHNLDYKRSEVENGIKELKKKYQSGGASTLISQAKAPVYGLPEKKQFNPNQDIDKETGEIHPRYTNRTYTKLIKDKEGNVIGKVTKAATEKSTRMAETKDAFTLSSGSNVEVAYANYANQLKALANSARKEYMAVGSTKKDPTAAKVYAEEVSSLNAKLNEAKKNAPRERQAQRLANVKISAAVKADPSLKSGTNDAKTELNKIRQRAIADSRAVYGAGAKKHKIPISDKEWEAIMNNAFSSATLEEIFRYSDSDSLKDRAFPKTRTTLSDAKKSKIVAMKNSGYTIAEIADSLGVSNSTVQEYIK